MNRAYNQKYICDADQMSTHRDVFYPRTRFLSVTKNTGIRNKWNVFLLARAGTSITELHYRKA